MINAGIPKTQAIATLRLADSFRYSQDDLRGFYSRLLNIRNISEADAILEGESLSQEIDVKTDNFKKWSDNAPVVDDSVGHAFTPGESVVVRAAHGSTHDIEAFRPGIVENDLGAGIYFSNSMEDISENYAQQFFHFVWIINF